MIQRSLMLLYFLGGANLIMLVLVALGRVRSRQKERQRTWVRNFIQVAFRSAPLEEVVRVIQTDLDSFLDSYVAYADSVQLPETDRQKLRRALVLTHQFPRLLRRLRRGGRVKRMESAIRLSYALATDAAAPLIDALERERHRSVKLHIVQALIQVQNPAVVPAIIDSLSGSDAEYQKQVFGILAALGPELFPFLDLLRDRTEPEIELLLMRIATLRADTVGRDFLVDHVRSADPQIRHESARLLLDSYLHAVDMAVFMESDDLLVRNLAVEALGGLTPERGLSRLLEAAEQPSLQKSAVVGLSRLVRNRPETYAELVGTFLESERAGSRSVLIQVLANRVEYLIERVIRSPETSWTRALEALIRSGRVNGMIAFLNRNTDEQIEQKLTRAMAPAVADHDPAQRLIAEHGSRSVVERFGLERMESEASRSDRVGESVRPVFVLSIIAAAVFLPIGIYAAVRVGSGASSVSLAWITDYLRLFSVGFGVYAFALNLIYLVLIVAAAFAVRSQQRLLEIKPLSMLFSPGVLPAISIIAPAYNEEQTIVESVRSLLNLRYPSLEIIVVNDGSRDRTLAALIREFELERTDIFVHGYLHTKPIQGVYRSAQVPELVVLDKQNGGKADSLNAGINAAKNDYFAAIDSDSLLERDSLLRLAARFLDSEKPVVATGGNIFPVNGCRVSDGVIEQIRLPRKMLGKMQTLEYLRSFMSGRTGWAALNSLMIISGAFGVFKRQVVVDAHGYLTGSGHYGKDTVAEDMELVVRIARTLRDQGRPFAIQYGYNANCWTEVPTSFRILKSQRDRWQRGLIDTMIFHLRMLGNPRYGAMGTIGFPYFFVFELLGPWFEIQGLLFLVAGLILGVVPTSLLLFVIATTIPLGIVVSLASLLLAEYNQRYFTGRDRAVLILFAVLENLGYRQYAGLIRLRGYLSTLFRRTGWGTMVRTGFQGGSKNNEK